MSKNNLTTEKSMDEKIEEKYTKYLDCETDTLELTIDEAIYILENDEEKNYVSDLLQEVYKIILSDYKKVLKEAKKYKNMYEAEHEIHLVRNEQLDRKENAVAKCNELIIENAKLKEENEHNKLLLDTNKNFTIDKKNGNYKWNVIEIQKIKDKIEEVEKEKLNYSEDEWYLESEIKGYAIDKLQELLESEE